MVAVLVLASLLAALGACAAVAYAVWLAGGASLATGVLIVVVFFLTLHGGMVALGCALSRLWRAAGSAPLGAGGFLRLVADETFAFLQTFVAGQLLQPWLAPRDPERIVRGVLPTLLVHGLYCNAGVWHRLLARLRRQGVPNLFCLNLTPPFAGIDHFAQQLAQRVDEICRACGTPQAIIVAHSMGGLATRAWCARLNGRRRLARLVTIGTPHRGSRLARLVPGRCAAEMIPGSAWLARLEADEARAPSPPALCIFSWHDDLVAPQDSAQRAGAAALALERRGHLQLLLDPTVQRRVAAEIAAARSESPS